MHKTKIIEEIFAAITHGVGLILAIVGFVFLLLHSVRSHNVTMTICFVVFGITCILVYLASTLYHSLMFTSAKYVLRKIDHSVIFLYIAGSYTPFIMLFARSFWSWILLGCVWSMAAFGIVIQIFKKNNFAISLFLYLFFGWFVLIIAKPFLVHMQPNVIIMLLAGGILYTVGVLFYLWRKLFFHHVIWHFFVLGGGIFHYMAMFYLK